MNKNALMKTIILFCALVLIAAVALGVTKVAGFTGYHYENAKKYTAGGTELSGKIKNLDIDWTSGKVDIAFHSSDTIVISETSDEKISDDMQLRWWLDGDTLRIRYAKNGFSLRSLFRQQKKALTVTLPEGIVLGSVEINATSAAMNIPEMKAEDLDLSVTSGGIIAAADAGRVKMSATSGSLNLKSSGNAEEIKASVTSGIIDITAEDAGSVTADATSGSIHVAAKSVGAVRAGMTSGVINIEVDRADTAKIDSTSGDVTFQAEEADELDIDCTSGDVKVFLTEDTGFTASLDATSGKISYDLPLTKDGSSYVCGDGKDSVKIETTSGDIYLGILDK